MKIIPDILSAELLAELKRHSRVEPISSTNLTSWSRDLTGWSGAIMLWGLEGKLLSWVRDELAPHVPRKYRHALGYSWHAQLHLGSRLSYLPWHNDGTKVLNATVYLNENWLPECAGYFLYQPTEGDHSDIRAILPQHNLGLIYETPLMHSVALSNVHAPLRESLQVFVIDRNAEEEGSEGRSAIVSSLQARPTSG